MSVFSEFHKAWLARFPGNELPAAWEEDVRTNLAKHRTKVALLKEELEKEQFYVEYLERLLEDVRRQPDSNDSSQKNEESVIIRDVEEERGQGEGSEGAASISNCDEDSAITQTINQEMVRHRRSPSDVLDTSGEIIVEEHGGCGDNKVHEKPGAISTKKFTESVKSEATATIIAPISPMAETAAVTSGKSVKDLARQFTHEKSFLGGSHVQHPPTYQRSASVPTGASQFVTVISVNNQDQQEDRCERKVPPVPPPKSFRRSMGTEPDIKEEQEQSKLSGTSPSPGLAHRPQYPIPSPRSPRVSDPLQRPDHPPPPTPSKLPIEKNSIEDETSSKESPILKRNVQTARSNSHELEKSPSNASSTVSLCKKSLSKSSSSASSCGNNAPPQQISFESSHQDGEEEKEVLNSFASRVSMENLTDDEPLYDTVAPDEDDHGEYVVLSEKDSDYNGTDTIKSIASGASSEGGLSKEDGGPDSPKYSNYVNIDFFLKK
ncbi:unnamed protein product, partial [Meganyctiphanes norvegica]